MRMGTGSASLLLRHGRGIGPQDASKKDYPIFLGLRQETLGSINLCRRSQGACQSASEKSGTLWIWKGPFVTQLGLVQSKRASSRMEAGTSGVLSISDSGRRVPAEYGQESHASSSVEEWISPCLSSCSRSDRPLVELSVEPAGFSGR